jgi:hypothetical protein
VNCADVWSAVKSMPFASPYAWSCSIAYGIDACRKPVVSWKMRPLIFGPALICGLSPRCAKLAVGVSRLAARASMIARTFRM